MFVNDTFVWEVDDDSIIETEPHGNQCIVKMKKLGTATVTVKGSIHNELVNQYVITVSPRNIVEEITGIIMNKYFEIIERILPVRLFW